MKKSNKPVVNEPVVIDEEILRKAKLALQSDRPVNTSKCVICGSEAAPTSTENLVLGVPPSEDQRVAGLGPADRPPRSSPSVHVRGDGYILQSDPDRFEHREPASPAGFRCFRREAPQRLYLSPIHIRRGSDPPLRSCIVRYRRQ